MLCEVTVGRGEGMGVEVGGGGGGGYKHFPHQQANPLTTVFSICI